MIKDAGSNNYKTHTILLPENCGCDSRYNCSICDGGLAFCTVCKGGEIELEQKTCEERLREQSIEKEI